MAIRQGSNISNVSNVSTASKISAYTGYSAIRSTIDDRLEKLDKEIEDPQRFKRLQQIAIAYNCFFFVITFISLQVVAYGTKEAFFGDCYDSRGAKDFEDTTNTTYKCSGERYISNEKSLREDIGRVLIVSFFVSFLSLQMSFIFGAFGIAYLDTTNMLIYAGLFNAATILMLFSLFMEQIVGKKGPLDYFRISPAIIGIYIAIICYEEIVFIISIYVFVKYKNKQQ